MKKENIVSGIKNAAVVATAVFTMNSCGNKQLSEGQLQMAQHKTDSALRVHPEYTIANATLELCEMKIANYRDANKKIVKMYARDYVKKNIKDAALAKFMLGAMNDDAVLFLLDNDDNENDNVSVNTLATMRYVRSTQRWFNDMILYLNGRYTEQQLLNSDFFNVVNSAELKRKFEYNTKQIEYVNSCMEFPLNRKNIIQTEVFNKYQKEVKRQR